MCSNGSSSSSSNMSMHRHQAVRCRPPISLEGHTGTTQLPRVVGSRSCDHVPHAGSIQQANTIRWQRTTAVASGLEAFSTSLRVLRRPQGHRLAHPRVSVIIVCGCLYYLSFLEFSSLGCRSQGTLIWRPRPRLSSMFFKTLPL